jgi:hypothetical protein
LKSIKKEKCENRNPHVPPFQYQKLYYFPFQIARKNSPCVNAEDIYMPRNENQKPLPSPHFILSLTLKINLFSTLVSP